MNEHFEPQNIIKGSPAEESETLALIKKVQQHLVFLEKKIDILIAGKSNPSFKPKHFSRPVRPGDPDRRKPWTGGGHHSHERNSAGPGSFGHSHGGQDRGFRHKKKRPFRHGKERY